MRRCHEGQQTAQATGARRRTCDAGVAADAITDSLGSMAVSLEISCAQLLADTTDTFMTESEALGFPSMAFSAPPRLVRHKPNG